jgi:hypothetical protein
MRKTLSEQIVARIERAIAAGHSQYAISKATGVDESTISRARRGISWFSRKGQDAIAEHLGLKLAADRATSKAKNKSGHRNAGGVKMR